MQFAFRFSYNYGKYILSTDSRYNQPSRMLGDNIQVLLKQGNTKKLKFGGVMDAKLVTPNHQKVKVVNLESYTKDVFGFSQFIDLIPGYAVGVYLHQVVYLLIQDNAPVVIPT